MTAKTKRTATRPRKSSKAKPTRQEQEIWVGIDSVVRSIRKIQRRIKRDGEPVSQLEFHELKRLGREYASLMKRLPTDNNN